MPAPWFPETQSDASCAARCLSWGSLELWLICAHLDMSHSTSGDSNVVITVTYTHCTAKQLLGMWDSCSATFISHFSHLFSPLKYCMVLCLIIFSFAGKGDFQSSSQREWFTLVIKQIRTFEKADKLALCCTDGLNPKLIKIHTSWQSVAEIATVSLGALGIYSFIQIYIKIPSIYTHIHF